METAQCAVCSQSGNHIRRDKEMSVFQCARCGHVFSVILPERQKKYDDHYFLEEHTHWFAHPNTRLFHRIISRINSQFNEREIALLDVGCGNGDFLLFAGRNRAHTKLYGTDLVQIFKDPGVSFLEGDFSSLTFHQKFDVITSLFSIEHIENPLAFSEKMVNLLRPDGCAFIVTVNSTGLIYQAAAALKRIGIRGPYARLYDPAHFHHFTPDSLRGLLERAGCEVLSQRNHNFPVAAIDVPKSNWLLEHFYRVAAAVLFIVSAIFGGGMFQTAVCRKRG